MTELTYTKSRRDTGWQAPLIGGLLALTLAFAICAGLVAWGHQTFPRGDTRAVRRITQALPVLEGGAATFYGFKPIGWAEMPR